MQRLVYLIAVGAVCTPVAFASDHTPAETSGDKPTVRFDPSMKEAKESEAASNAKGKPEDAFRKTDIKAIKSEKSAEKSKNFNELATKYTTRLNNALATFGANLEHKGVLGLKLTKDAREEAQRRKDAVSIFMEMYNKYIDDPEVPHGEKFNRQQPIASVDDAEKILKKMIKGNLKFVVSITDRLGGEGSVTIISDSNNQPITPLKLADLSEVSRQAGVRKAAVQDKIAKANAELQAETNAQGQ
jgi:hypothetical protein